MDPAEIKHFIEAALLAAGRPLSVDQLQKLFDGRMAPEKSEIRQAITTLNDEYDGRGSFRFSRSGSLGHGGSAAKTLGRASPAIFACHV